MILTKLSQGLAVILVLLASPLFGQIMVDNEYSEYSPVEYGLATPDTANALWEIKPLDNQTEFSSRQYTKQDGTVVYAFWGQPGRYELEAVVLTVDVDWETQVVKPSLKKYNATFKIGGTPTPVPPPGPIPPGPVPPTPVPPVPPTPPSPSPIPNDEFDNLGQRLDNIADQIGLQFDLRNRVAEVFSSTAALMTEPGRFIQLSDVKSYLETELRKLSLDSSWDRMLVLLREDAKAREPMSWEAAYNWYRAAAAGFKGGKLADVAAIWHRPNKVETSINTISVLPYQMIPVQQLCPNGVCNVRP